MIKKNSEELLNMTLRELGLSISSNGMVANNDMAFDPNDVGIELVEEKPEINIKNLGLFMAKFGKHPMAEFRQGMSDNPFASPLISVVIRGRDRKFLGKCSADDRIYEHTIIIDPRWTKENLEDL